MTIYKSFIRPFLDCGNIIFDHPFNNFFQNKVESIQYNASLAMTDATRGTSKERPYEELHLELIQYCR